MNHYGVSGEVVGWWGSGVVATNNQHSASNTGPKHERGKLRTSLTLRASVSDPPPHHPTTFILHPFPVPTATVFSYLLAFAPLHSIHLICPMSPSFPRSSVGTHAAAVPTADRGNESNSLFPAIGRLCYKPNPFHWVKRHCSQACIKGAT